MGSNLPERRFWTLGLGRGVLVSSRRVTMKHGARPEQMTLGPCENDLDPPKSMVSAHAPDLATSIADLRQRIAVVRPRVAECVRVGPRINELADAIQRGDINRPEAVTMQAEINGLWASLPPVREQATIV